VHLRISRLLKISALFSVGLFLFSCVSRRDNKNLTWYRHQVIEQIVLEEDSSYRVQIGIMATSFWLDNQDGLLANKLLLLLQQSFTRRNKVNVAVQHGTNKIVRVTKSE